MSDEGRVLPAGSGKTPAKLAAPGRVLSCGCAASTSNSASNSGREASHVCTPHCDDERGHYPAPAGREAAAPVISNPHAKALWHTRSACPWCRAYDEAQPSPPARETTPNDVTP